MDIRQKKRKIRGQLLKRREAIAEEEFKKASESIIKKLKQLPEYQGGTLVHCYVSMNNRGEVDTHQLIKDMHKTSKRVAVSITNFQDNTLSHVILSSFDDLESNKWGVLEPKNGKPVSPTKIDLVIVPMVGGDEKCNRIGYGKGFYDRFLKEVTCPKIGLIFEQNIVNELPVLEFDIPLDKIITERRIITRQ